MQLSIIIPVHNRPELLREAIESITEQGLDSCEIIICDDGSDVGIEEVCADFELSKDQLKYSRTEESHGAQVARNRGLSIAEGEFVMFMDSDDVLAGKGPRPLLEALESDTDYQYAYGKVSRVDHSLQSLSGDVPVGSAFKDEPVEIAGYHWHTMGAVYRRSYLETVGPWNEKMTGSQDWEYQARVKLAGGKGKFVDESVGYWRQHGGDRVGTSKFRPDYVRSVMIGCESVLRCAQARGHCDAALERRLARRLAVHAFEWGANGCWRERKECFLQAKNGISSDLLFRMTLSLLAHTPSILDGCLLRRITAKK